MWEFDDLSFAAETFSGKARLFPLPNLVMFPHVLQPLHVFEPRYREMVESALADDRLIALVRLEPGWEAEYEGRPPVAPVACLGKIATHHKLEEGEYNILLVGLRRIRLLRELAPLHSFREAEVELIEDRYSPDSAAELAALQRKLVTRFQSLLPQLPVAGESLEQLLTAEVPLGVLTDVVSYTLELELDVKQQLLDEPSVTKRGERLLEILATFEQRERGGFPPRFSDN